MKDKNREDRIEPELSKKAEEFLEVMVTNASWVLADAMFQDNDRGINYRMFTRLMDLITHRLNENKSLIPEVNRIAEIEIDKLIKSELD